jgi:3-hydroxy-9,10-secoandrosta-1,3,5(10)-triene-9,17-dione monooxygenase
MSTNNPTREEILNRARELAPVVASRTKQADELRRMPDETVDDFREAGFYRILQPEKFGGFELPYGVQTELAMELGRGCASSAWDASITACHAWIGGMYTPKAQEQIWGDDQDTMLSTSFRSAGHQAQPDDGGIRLSGKWKFSSGVRHCGWVILALDVPLKESERPNSILALVPLSACTIEDTWYASGLTATGSNDVVVRDHFLPDYRILNVMELRGQETPGSAVNAHYNYRLPLHGVFSFNIIGSAIGAARLALDSVVEGLSGHVSVTSANVGQQPAVRLRISEARAATDAACALVMKNLAEISQTGASGETPTMEQRLRYRTDNGFAAKLCLQAVDVIYPLLGARGLNADDPANRAWRDVHAITNHIALTWDVQGILHSAHLLGFPSPDPRV